MRAPPIVTNRDAAIDVEFFAANPQRFCYARAVSKEWILVIKRVPMQREHDIMMRAWGPGTKIPDTDPECLALWNRLAWPQK